LQLPPPLPDTVSDGYTYDPKSRRDPFQSMVQLIKIAKAQSELPPLQRVEINDLKLLGIVWGGYGYFGLIQTPDGKGYTVKEGMLVGPNHGVVKSISQNRMVVSEPTIDINGKKTKRDIEIPLRAKEGMK
jgi:type IV pilus assembly protein PilP